MDKDAEHREERRAEVFRVPTPGMGSEGRAEYSFFQIVNVFLRHRWKVVGLPLALATVVVAVSVFTPDVYTSDTSFMSPSEGMQGQLSQLSGVASQFGIDVPTGSSGQSPSFYVDLLRSRRLLKEAATTGYSLESSGSGAVTDTTAGAVGQDSEESQASRPHAETRTLVQLFELDSYPEPLAVEEAAERLRENLSVSARSETGVTSLAVSTRWPTVSEQVAERLVELVNQFNNEVRRSQASEQATFVRERLAEARKELRTAENRLEKFLKSNVGWEQSPELRFERNRLQRRVSLRQEVYNSLASRYEEARISEVRSTPVVTTILEPEVPVEPDSNNLPLRITVSLLFGGLIGLVWAFGAEYVATVRNERSDEYREYLSLKGDAAQDVRKVGRRLRRIVDGSSSNTEG